jgi:hypothetical protein
MEEIREKCKKGVMRRRFKRLFFMKQRDYVLNRNLAALISEKKHNENVSLEKHETLSYFTA